MNVNRENVISIILHKWAHYNDANDALQASVDAIREMPAGDPCDDAISRDAAIDAISFGISNIRAFKEGTMIRFYEHENKALQKAIERINELPSVTQKSGKWINDKNDMPICSQCGYIPQYDRAIDDYEYSNYCPNCGAKMESEDKE